MVIAQGATLGSYTIGEQLGRGGMAAVYKAYHTRLDRYVAIKVMLPVISQDPGFRERFEQEARAVARFRHPNIMTIYDFGEQQGLAYLVTELIDGGTLADLTGSPLDPGMVVRVIGPIASALDYAHERGVLHRDVKPSNILLRADMTPVLSDFGIAKLSGSSAHMTRTGLVMGTPAYQAPEQASGEPASNATDQYALGIVAYELLTGRVPFSAETPMAVLLAHLVKPLPPPREVNPALSEDIERVLLKTLAKRPDERYPTVSEFAMALAEAVAIGGYGPMVAPGPTPSNAAPSTPAWLGTPKTPVQAPYVPPADVGIKPSPSIEPPASAPIPAPTARPAVESPPSPPSSGALPPRQAIEPTPAPIDPPDSSWPAPPSATPRPPVAPPATPVASASARETVLEPASRGPAPVGGSPIVAGDQFYPPVDGGLAREVVAERPASSVISSPVERSGGPAAAVEVPHLPSVAPPPSQEDPRTAPSPAAPPTPMPAQTPPTEPVQAPAYDSLAAAAPSDPATRRPSDTSPAGATVAEPLRKVELPTALEPLPPVHVPAPLSPTPSASAHGPARYGTGAETAFTPAVGGAKAEARGLPWPLIGGAAALVLVAGALAVLVLTRQPSPTTPSPTAAPTSAPVVGAVATALASVKTAAPTLLATAIPTAAPAAAPTSAPAVQPTAAPAAVSQPSPTSAAAATATPGEEQAWQQQEAALNAIWGKDWPQTIAQLNAFLKRYPNNTDAKDKLYAALISYGDQLSQSGDKAGAAAQYSAAHQVYPDRPEASAALAALTPTPVPTPTSTPVPQQVQQQPPSQPQQQQQPPSQPQQQQPPLAQPQQPPVQPKPTAVPIRPGPRPGFTPVAERIHLATATPTT